MNTKCTPAVEVNELTEEEMWNVFDGQARLLLNISGSEFEEKWHAGEYAECDDPAITRVAMLLPSAW